MGPNEDLTPAQMKALEVFSTLPGASLQEWAAAMEVAYTTVLHYRIALVRKGYLTSIPGKARTTRLTPKAEAFLND